MIMESTQYKCPKCNREWTGNEYATVCPECQYDQGSSAPSKRSKWYIIGAVVLLIGTVAGIVVLILSGSDPQDGSRYKVSVNQVEDYVQVDIERYFQKEGKQTSEHLSPNAFEASLPHLQFRNELGGAISFKDGNRIYPCEDGDVYLYWRNTEAYPLKDQNDTLKLLSFKLPGKSPNPSADCGDTLQLKIIEVKPGPEGTIIIVTNMDGQGQVMISVTGRKGPYMKNQVFPFQGNEYKMDVWAYSAGTDTAKVPPVDWRLNGDKIYPIRKEKIEPDARASIEKDFMRLANAFGNEPDRDAAAAFNQFLARNSVHPTVVLNGDELKGGVSEMLNRLPIDHENDGKSFRIKPGSLLMGENGKITKFEFMEVING